MVIKYFQTSSSVGKEVDISDKKDAFMIKQHFKVSTFMYGFSMNSSI